MEQSMRIIFIRHGDPDYEKDSLTEKGWREADLLSRRMIRETVGGFYVSPLGRAKDTASLTLMKTGREAETLDWLQEFPTCIDINGREELLQIFPDTRKDGDTYQIRIPWDMMPSGWVDQPEYCDPEDWVRTPVAEAGPLEKEFERVSTGFDELLARYGYVRSGRGYHTEKGSEVTICLFCHFGVICAMLSHLWNISPFVLWHGLVLAPTSVTEVFTEEREEGVVQFRATKAGDISPLYVADEPPAFAARFCETFDNKEQRH